ncbi:MAG: hypothetical protein ABIJ61_04540 [bacterium]
MKYLKYLAPLLMLLVVLSVWGCERKIVVEDNSGDGNGAELASCFGCHGDENLAVRHAREEWAISKHGSGETVERNRVHDEGYESCERCHTQEGFIAYITDTEVEAPYHFSHIGCFTCHAPHTNGDLELRTAAALTMPDGSAYNHGAGNLCANCHQSRVDVNTYVVAGATLSSRFGPHHGPQGDMLNGTNGYEYASYNYTNSTHTTAVADGCVDCHMAGAAGYSGVGMGGHTWSMENEEDEQVNTAGCNASGCHSGLATLDKTANSDYDHDGYIEGVMDEVQGLLDSLEVLLTAEGVFANGSPASVTVDDIGVVGAVYNYQFVAEDRSMGVHNTAYTVGLLQSAIDYLNSVALAKL